MNQREKVSVILVSYHTGPILGRTLDALLELENVLEIILVDNGNPDDVRSSLRKFAENNPKVRIIEGQGNVGFARGCNIGAQQARGEYILLLNPDCIIFDKASLTKIIYEMEKYPDVWMAGCRIVLPDGALQTGNKRNILTPQVLIWQGTELYRFGQYGKFMPINIKDDTPDSSSYVPAISGAFMMFPANKYKETGGLDEKYFFHVEDLDLCLEIKKRGGKILYIPSVQVIHFKSSSEVPSIFVERCKARGFLYYFKKHKGTLYNGAFYPILVCLIWLRLITRLIPLYFKKIVSGNRITSARERDKRINSIVLRLMNREDIGRNLRKTGDIGPVLVTGVTNQVGAAVLKILLEDDIEAYALYHNTAIDLRHPRLKWLHGDLEKGLFNFDEIKAKTLIHAAHIWLLPDHIERFAKMGINRIICISHSPVKAFLDSENSYEKELARKTITSEDKIKEICDKLRVNYTVFRTNMVYGFGLDQNITAMAEFIKNFGFFMTNGIGSGMRQPVHAADIAESMIKIADMPVAFGKIYYLSGGSKLSYVNMIRKIFSVLNKRQRIFNFPLLPFMLDIYSAFSGRENINGEVAKRMNLHLVFDDNVARQDFGYSPRAFLENDIQDLGIF